MSSTSRLQFHQELHEACPSLLPLLFQHDGNKPALLCWQSGSRPNHQVHTSTRDSSLLSDHHCDSMGEDTIVLDYQWLFDNSHRLARRLRLILPQSTSVTRQSCASRVLSPQPSVALLFGSATANAIVAMVAAQLLRIPFVLLDSLQPPQVLERTCAQAQCRVLIYESSNREVDRWPFALELEPLPMNTTGDVIDDKGTCNLGAPRVASTDSSGSILYMMATSGSTGTPKLVQGTMRGLLNRIRWQNDLFPYDAPGEVGLARTSLGFVDCLAEIFVPLVAGVPLVVVQAPAVGAAQDSSPTSRFRSQFASVSKLIKRNPWRDPAIVRLACCRFRVSRLVVTPTFLGEFLREGPLLRTAPSLSYLHCSGEAFPMSMVDSVLKNASSNLKLLNIYGSTEVGADVACHVFSSHNDLPPSMQYAPVGNPITGCRILLLRQKTSTIWTETEEGEMFVAGVQVAMGYLGQATSPAYKGETRSPRGFCWLTQKPESPDEWQVTHEPESEGSLWSFRMGDYAVRNSPEHGSLQVLGRTDQNVKIRGIRVSLLETEAALQNCRVWGVAEVLNRGVSLNQQGPAADETILAALVCLKSNTRTRVTCHCPSSEGNIGAVPCESCELSLRCELRRVLREAAVPQRIFFCNELPTLSSGKLDRATAKKVLAAAISKHQKETLGSTGTLESSLSENPESREAWVWWFREQFRALLGVPASSDDSFFDLGGTSITSIRLLSQLRSEIERLGLVRMRRLVDKESMLEALEDGCTPRKLTGFVLARWHIRGKEPDRVLPLLSNTSLFEFQALQEDDIEEVSALAEEAFCRREPLTSSLLSRPKRSVRFRALIRRLCRDLVREGLSFVARKRCPKERCDVASRSSRGEMEAFALAGAVEHCGPLSPSVFFARIPSLVRRAHQITECFHPTRLPELQPADDLYSETFERWSTWRDVLLSPGECVQIMMSGASKSCHFGSIAVSGCESAALCAARAKDFRLAYTICTSEVTSYIFSRLS